MFEKNTKKNADGQVTNVICNSAKQGLIPQREYFDKDIANSDNTNGYYIIADNDFVYNPRKSADAPYGPISRYKYAEDGIVSPLYLCFRAKKEINPAFFEWYFRSSAWHRYIYMSGDSGARHDRVSIKDDTFFSMPINIPSTQEQTHIASFLEKIDLKIAKQRALVDALKKYKRGVISKIFSDITEYVSLCEICSYISSSNTAAQMQKKSFGTYPVYDAGGILMTISTYDNDFEYTAIIKDGSGVGRVQLCQKYSSFIGTLGALIPVRCSNYYLYTVLQNIDFRNFVTGMAIPHIYFKDYKNTLVPFPNEKMRNHIESISKYCDMRIDNAEKTLVILQSLKGGLMQKMFI